MSTRLIGIDPGYDRLGFAVLEIEAQDYHVLDFGYISSDKQKKFEQRLVEISTDLKEIVKQYNVEEAGVEDIYIQKNIKTVIQVSHARGVVIELLSRLGVSVFDYRPQEIKISLCGYGRATKKDVEHAVLTQLGISGQMKQDDTTDALAIAVCHAQSRRIKKIYEK